MNKSMPGKTATERSNHKQVRMRQEIYESYDWSLFSERMRRRKVLEEQNGLCLHCSLDEWLGQKLVLELDHIDGNHSNNVRSNLRFLCPNCHSLTPTHRNKARVAQLAEVAGSNPVHV